jgi:hypothetical protein
MLSGQALLARQPRAHLTSTGADMGISMSVRFAVRQIGVNQFNQELLVLRNVFYKYGVVVVDSIRSKHWRTQ